jgi:hypothetical protein
MGFSLVIWNASSSNKRVLGPLEERASGECRYERPADRAVAAESAGAARTWRGKFIVIVLSGRYLVDAARDPAMCAWIAKQVCGGRTRPPRTHRWHVAPDF